MQRTTLILGVGSPFGDDQAGWLVAARMAQASLPATKAAAIVQPIELLDHLQAECGKLIVVDAARGEPSSPGVRRLPWPCPAMRLGSASSSHGLGLAYVLQTAQQLGRLPPQVVCYVLESAVMERTQSPNGPLSGEMALYVEEAVCRISAEVADEWRPHHA